MNFPINIPWDGKYLTGSIQYPECFASTHTNYPLIIICHGFIGSRIGVDRLFVKASNELIKEDCVVVRFDYSGCGESEGEYGKTGLDDLIEQTKAVIDYSLQLKQIDKEEVILLGHSLGGATALLTSIKDNRIKKLILWSAVGQPFEDITNIIGAREVARIKASDSIDYLGFSFYEKFFHSLVKYSPLMETENFLGDVLIVHGSADSDIPVDYGHQYYNGFNKRRSGSCQKEIILDANHTYSSGNHFQELITLTCKWVAMQTSKQLV